MKSIRTIICLLFCITIALSCKDETNKVVKKAAISFEKEGTLSIFKQQTDSLITSFDIEIADNDYETQTGLMYRSSMKANRGMLFVFPNEAMHSFYMKNTQFPLDLIYIKEDFTIASFQENAEPFNENGLSSKVPVKYVFEINAGLVQKWHLTLGDRVEFKKL